MIMGLAEVVTATDPDDGGQVPGGLSAEDAEWVRRTVEELGPLDAEDRDYLALVFQGRRSGDSDR